MNRSGHQDTSGSFFYVKKEEFMKKILMRYIKEYTNNKKYKKRVDGAISLVFRLSMCIMLFVYLMIRMNECLLNLSTLCIIGVVILALAFSKH